MKVTVVVDQSGKVLGCVQAHQSEGPVRSESHGMSSFPSLIAKEGQSIQELTVPDELRDLSAPELHARLGAFVQ